MEELHQFYVSIPFKREGLSELPQNFRHKDDSFSFNSLQTGRTFRTLELFTLIGEGLGFQFPSNGKDFPNLYKMYATILLVICFNSLQTGRTFRTVRKIYDSFVAREFQFPSNGKDFPNKDKVIKGKTL